MPLTVV